MAVDQGPSPSQAFGATNASLRKEIANDLLTQLTYVGDLMRTQDSIAISDNFHLDSRMMTSGNYKGYYKVDVQYRRGTKKTVGEIMLSPDAVDLDDATYGLTQSVSTGYIYIVTPR
jgi:hypothetical protein